MKYSLSFKVSFHLAYAETEEYVKEIEKQILSFFKPFSDTIGATVSTDYANEFVENDNCSHSVIYLSFIRVFKVYPPVFHAQSVLLNFCYLIQYGDLCTHFRLDNALSLEQ